MLIRTNWLSLVAVFGNRLYRESLIMTSIHNTHTHTHTHTPVPASLLALMKSLFAPTEVQVWDQMQWMCSRGGTKQENRGAQIKWGGRGDGFWCFLIGTLWIINKGLWEAGSESSHVVQSPVMWFRPYLPGSLVDQKITQQPNLLTQCSAFCDTQDESKAFKGFIMVVFQPQLFSLVSLSITLLQTKTSQQLLDAVPWTFHTDIHGPQRMNSADVSEPLVPFPSATLAHQSV